MKKLLLTLVLIFSSTILLAQNFNQPTQFNNVCDDNNDGFAFFWLGEISLEILGNLNSQDYVITHHETAADAEIGANALSSPYQNINSLNQTIFVRIVTVATSQVTIMNYNLIVGGTPDAPTQTVTNCANLTTGFPCWNIAVVMPGPAQIVTYHVTEADAQMNLNPISNPACYISPVAAPNQPPVFYRIEFPLTGCFAVGTIELITIDCENSNCLPPTQLVVANITQNSATLSWISNGTETSWNIAIMADGAPAYSFVTDVNPYVLTDLSCGTNYQFFVTANCASGVGSVSNWGVFSTMSCVPQSGQAINLSVCGDNALGCFDLTVNNNNIIGSLNPSEYTITYYLTQGNADNNVSAITNPTNFCSQHGTMIFARLQNNMNPTSFQTFSFGLIVDGYSNDLQIVGDMDQCDDNNDSIVTFNLTNVEAIINTTNTLEYYPSLANAQNQVTPFSNPSALNVNVQSQNIGVFVREIVPNDCDVIYTFQLHAYANCNLAYTCTQANSLCNALGAPFSNTINNPSTGTFNCLGSTPNPTWFYLPISSPGPLDFQISQLSMAGNPLDVDYIVYGPFTDPITPCSNNNQLLSNVVSCSFSAAAIENLTIPNTQIGQFYLVMVTNYSNQAGLITIWQTNQGLNGSGAINCSGLQLNAFLDSNNNGVKDNGESNFPLGQFTYEVNDNGNVHNIVSPSGMYHIYDTIASNSYDFSFAIDPSYAASYGITTSSYSNIHVLAGAGMQVYNFPITVTQAYNDLAVTIIPVTAPRPGFTYLNKIRYSNNGNQTVAAGTLTFNHEANVAIIANSQTGTTPITDGFTYNFSNLLPFESREITVTMQVATIPTVTIGDLLTNTATIAPLTGDVVPANNTSISSQVIIGSYDPNDKMEAHGGRILHSAFTSNDYLTYTIRFENSGTASAENVRINDVLDSDLDESTIRMISASHPYVMDRVGSNINWLFDNIQLPPSVADTNIGKGYITFKVKPRAGYSIGDIIPNTASIYFDFNPAIITNTFNTEFVAQLGVGEFENADFVFYPNPVSDIVTIKVKNSGTIANIALYDVSGKMIMAQKPATALSTQTLDLSSVSKGMYLLEVTTDSSLKVVKKLIVE